MELESVKFSGRGIRLYNDMDTKQCVLCLDVKPTDEFRKNRINGKEYFRYACKKCDNRRHRKYEKNHQQERVANRKKQRRDPAYRAKYVLQDCRASDKKKNLECDLTIEFVVRQLGYMCGYCEATSETIMMTLDRIDNSLGHLQSNVRPCCRRCNRIKSNMPDAAWLRLVPTIRQLVKEGAFGSWWAI